MEELCRPLALEYCKAGLSGHALYCLCVFIMLPCPVFFWQTLIQDVIFPLMCHSDEDEEMWKNDPHEYIRVKYGK